MARVPGLYSDKFPIYSDKFPSLSDKFPSLSDKFPTDTTLTHVRMLDIGQ